VWQVSLQQSQTHSEPAVSKANTSALKVKFKALAAGSCLIGYGEINPEGGFPIYSWCGIGKGSTSIRGRAEVVPYSPDSHNVIVNPW